ncbi:GCN5-related N-acetyltransferase:acetyl-CoA hydrolase/transferase [Burkholderia sp. H160]|nr:GCN5-related N-acetyltransferase:acetyl-CoA hydrolase/transferase [Burkholderia sp. H160]
MRLIHRLSEVRGRLRERPTLVLHSACAEPVKLATMLAEEAACFKGAEVLSLMPMGESPYGNVPAATHLSVTTFFPGKGLRAAVTAGRAKTLRHPLSAIPAFFDRDEIRADLVLLQVSPPDANGKVSLGLSVDYMHAVLRQKPLVVAEINPALPRTCGHTLIDVSEIDYYVDADGLPQSVAPSTGDEIDARIAANIAALIDDGSVLQIGIGSLPDRVLGRLGDRRHLGLHSGIITEAVRPLIESGVIDNSTKGAFRGVSVTTMVAGTQAFYDFLDGNAAVEFHPCSLTHSASVLSHIERLTAVNSALQIDLSGNVNAEAVGGRIVAAPGGLPDFAHGAVRAPRGRSILAVRARFKEHSNFVARLDGNAPISLEADAVDYVATEFGVASLRGLSPIQRAEALIAVAHPADQTTLQHELSLGTIE